MTIQGINELNDLVLDENSATYKLFYFPFYCLIPRFATFSYDSLEKFGSYYSSDDKNSAVQKEWKLMTINSMIEYFKQGVVVELVDAKDCEKIYTIITGHLRLWRDYGRYCGHPYNPPIEDFKYLDEFADLLHTKSYYYGDNHVEDLDYIELLSVLPSSSLRTVYDKENLFEQIVAIKEELGENPYEY